MKKVIIISAPSGAGKSTIIKSLPLKEFRLSFSISACNRTAREGEQNGKDYYFLSTEDFLAKIDNDDFLEWEEVYHQHYYGTLKSEIERIFEKKHFPIFDIDVAGGLRLKEIYGDNALAIFIMPPSVKELEKRLRLRATDSAENIKKRVDKANAEINFANKFDSVIINDELTKAIRETKEKIREFLKIN
jgi:guanylate kinase